MKASQECIYYMAGDSVDMLWREPPLVTFRKLRLEVMLLDEQLDAPCFQALTVYEGKRFVLVLPSQP